MTVHDCRGTWSTIGASISELQDITTRPWSVSDAELDKWRDSVDSLVLDIQELAKNTADLVSTKKIKRCNFERNNSY